MKTILVTTDLSASAHWATDYALAVACHFQARLTILHVYDPLPAVAPAHEWLTSTSAGQYYQAMQQLSALRNGLLHAAKEKVEISIIASPAQTSALFMEDDIIDEVQKQRADLLVMGLVGEQPLRARQSGSLATDLIPRAPVPMLLVPPGAVYNQPKQIVLAVDLKAPIDALALNTALRFAQGLNAAIDVVCIEDEPSPAERQVARHFRHLLRHFPHTFSFLPGYNVATALDTYLTEHRADLLMLLPKPHSRLRTWLVESVTQSVARTAIIPVFAAV